MISGLDKTLAEIMVSREKVGNEKKTLKLIDQAIGQTKEMIFQLTNKKTNKLK